MDSLGAVERKFVGDKVVLARVRLSCLDSNKVTRLVDWECSISVDLDVAEQLGDIQHSLVLDVRTGGMVDFGSLRRPTNFHSLDMT